MSNLGEAAEQFLQRQWPDDTIAVSNFAPIPGGYSRETYRFDAEVARGDGSRQTLPMILRKDPPGAAAILDSDRSVEHQVIERVRKKTTVPVSKSWFAEMDPATFGTPAMLLERAPGSGEPSQLFHGGVHADQAEDVVTALCEHIAELHLSDTAVLNDDGLLDDWRGLGLGQQSWQGYMDGMIQYFIDRYEDMAYDPLPIWRDLLLDMRRNPPRPLKVTPVHGDFNPSNFIYQDGKVTALIDWENTHLGDPREDLGWMAHMDLLSNTNIMGTPTKHGTFLEYYNKLTGFDVTEEEIVYFRKFTSGIIGVPVISAVARRAAKEHDELLHYYIIQPATVSMFAIAQMLGCPMPTAPEASAQEA